MREKDYTNLTPTTMKNLILLIGLCAMSCTKVEFEEQLVPENQPTEYLYDGMYEITKKVFIQSDGSEKHFFPTDTDWHEDVDGWFPKTLITFSEDSLFTQQLMTNGWSSGSVSVVWSNGVPTRIGCRYVETATESILSWKQEDVIIENHLIKL